MTVFTTILSGCSTTPVTSNIIEAKVTPTGPTVLNARSTPSTVELDNNLLAKQNPQILADVKDFSAPVYKVTARFTDVPIEVEMQKLQGTTWEATLTSEQVKKLAISGRSVKYRADVIATDDQGRSATSAEPIQIIIIAPDLARTTG